MNGTEWVMDGTYELLVEQNQLWTEQTDYERNTKHRKGRWGSLGNSGRRRTWFAWWPGWPGFWGRSGGTSWNTAEHDGTRRNIKEPPDVTVVQTKVLTDSSIFVPLSLGLFDLRRWNIQALEGTISYEWNIRASEGTISYEWNTDVGFRSGSILETERQLVHSWNYGRDIVEQRRNTMEHLVMEGFATTLETVKIFLIRPDYEGKFLVYERNILSRRKRHWKEIGLMKRTCFWKKQRLFMDGTKQLMNGTKWTKLWKELKRSDLQLNVALRSLRNRVVRDVLDESLDAGGIHVVVKKIARFLEFSAIWNKKCVQKQNAINSGEIVSHPGCSKLELSGNALWILWNRCLFPAKSNAGVSQQNFPTSQPAS